MGTILHEVEPLEGDSAAAAIPSSLKSNIFIRLKTWIQNKKAMKITIIIVLLFIVSIALFMMSQYGQDKKTTLSSLQTKNNEIILTKLNQVNDQLESLSSNPNNSKEQFIKLQGIEKNIAEIHQSVVAIAKSSDIQKVSNQIESMKEAVDSQMTDIKKAVTENMGNKQYLDSNVLPFSVVSIDVIGGEPYVSVNYADNVFPLSVTDRLAEWRLVTADYDLHTAEFVNEKDQYVKVNLQG